MAGREQHLPAFLCGNLWKMDGFYGGGGGKTADTEKIQKNIKKTVDILWFL